MQTNAVMQMNKILQAIFIAQAQDVSRNIPALLAGQELDINPWIGVMANATKPILLQQYQQGIARTAARIGAKINARPDYNEGLRRYRPGAFILGTKGVMRNGRGNTSILVTKAGWEHPVTFNTTPGRPLHIFKSWNRVVVKAQGDKQPVLMDFDLFNPKILNAVSTAAFAFCRETMETATTNLREALAKLRELMRQGLPQGDAVAHLAKKVREIFADPMRAFRIATTETSRAMHAGQLDTAEQSGIVTGKTWLASSDACEQCLDLDGKTVGLKEPFIILPGGGAYARVDHPPLHPHCFL